jgi:hypothetical protein
VKYLWFTVFYACFVAAISCVVAQAIGRIDLVPLCGAVATALIGLTFLIGSLWSATTVGEAWIAGMGWISKNSHPLVYWAALSVPLVLGLALLFGGLYFLVRQIVA